MPDLTTLARVKEWNGVTHTTDDSLLTRLITSVSQVVQAYLARPNLFLATYSRKLSGTGGQGFMFKEFPITAVSALAVDTVVVPAAANSAACGYTLEAWDGYPPGGAQRLTLRGYSLCKGLQNIDVTYKAGYAITGEAATIPGTPYAVTVAAPNGSWGQDDGVTFTDGTHLTKIASGSPAAGQYTVAAGGIYTFAAADTAKGVLISYSYIPAAIENQVIEIVSERYKYKGRIGETSRALNGNETGTYSQKDLTDYVKLALAPYRRVIT